MSTLHNLQNQFSTAVLSNGQSDSGVSNNSFDIEEALIAGPLAANRRLNIYRNNVTISLRNALKAVYPVIYKLVGKEFFDAMAKDYIIKHPSRSGNLHDFGDKLSSFIARFAPAGELVYLADVAKLEWAYHRVFHAQNSPPFDLQKLQEVAAANYGDLCFTLSPACRLLRSPYPILRIWQANQDFATNSSGTISLDEGETLLLVAREGLDIAFHLLSPTEFSFLEAFDQHKKFFIACDKANQLEPECDIGKLLQKFILSQAISDFSVAI